MVKNFFVAALFFAFLSNHAVSAATLLTTDYPEQNEVPDANPFWTTLFLKGVTLPLTTDTVLSTDQVANCGASKGKVALSFINAPSSVDDTILTGLTTVSTTSSDVTIAYSTFFSSGSNALSYNNNLKDISDAGHEVGTQAWSGIDLTTLKDGQIVSELVWSSMIVYNITGKVPRYFRAPLGSVNARVLAIAKAMDLVPIAPNFDSEDDTLEATSSTDAVSEDTYLTNLGTNIAALTDTQTNAGIISLHRDSNSAAADAIADTLAKFELYNYSPIKMSECVASQGKGAPYATSGKLYELLTGTLPTPSPPSSSTTTSNDGNSRPPSSNTCPLVCKKKCVKNT